MADKNIERLEVHTVFTGLTRPPMILGITLDYFSISMMFSLCSFIAMNSAWYLVLYIPLHVLGWIGCRIDPHIFKIIVKNLECLNIPNKKIWGCQSYDAF